MPSGYYFAKAEENDDKELRELIKKMPMEGSMRIIFQKEPDFFKAEKIGAVSLDVMLCKEKDSGHIVGFGSRSIRKVFVNGKPELIGYLSSLRAIPEVRGGTLVARAYKALHELHKDGKVPFYFTTIFDDNEPAKKILTSGRAGLPTYQDIGMLNTHIVTLNAKKTISCVGGLEIIRGSEELLSDIVEFLNQHNSKFQFAPYFEISDFENNFFPDFRIDDFYVAKINRQIVGVLGIWDQNSLKQTIVDGYSGKYKYLRQLYNSCAFLHGNPKLPKSGESINSVYVSFFALSPTKPEIFTELLNRVYKDLLGQKYSYFMIGLNELDLLNATLNKFTHKIVKSRMYKVFWKEDRDFKLDNKLPHLEIATL